MTDNRKKIDLWKSEDGEKFSQESRGIGGYVPPGMSYSAGETIPIGKFEFARVEISVEVPIPDGLGEQAAFAELSRYVDDLLRRESASVRKEEVPMLPEPPQWLKEGQMRISYGLTLSVGRYESAKADVGLWHPLAEDPNGAYDYLSETLSTQIRAWAKRVKGGGKEDVKPSKLAGGAGF